MDTSAFASSKPEDEASFTEVLSMLDNDFKLPIGATITVIKLVLWLAVVATALLMCVLLYVFIIAWLCLFWIQTQLLFGTSALLKSCMSGNAPVQGHQVSSITETQEEKGNNPNPVTTPGGVSDVNGGVRGSGRSANGVSQDLGLSSNSRLAEADVMGYWQPSSESNVQLEQMREEAKDGPSADSGHALKIQTQSDDITDDGRAAREIASHPSEPVVHVHRPTQAPHQRYLEDRDQPKVERPSMSKEEMRLQEKSQAQDAWLASMGSDEQEEPQQMPPVKDATNNLSKRPQNPFTSNNSFRDQMAEAQSFAAGATRGGQKGPRSRPVSKTHVRPVRTRQTQATPTQAPRSSAHKFPANVHQLSNSPAAQSRPPPRATNFVPPHVRSAMEGRAKKAASISDDSANSQLEEHLLTENEVDSEAVMNDEPSATESPEPKAQDLPAASAEEDMKSIESSPATAVNPQDELSESKPPAALESAQPPSVLMSADVLKSINPSPSRSEARDRIRDSGIEAHVEPVQCRMCHRWALQIDSAHADICDPCFAVHDRIEAAQQIVGRPVRSRVFSSSAPQAFKHDHISDPLAKSNEEFQIGHSDHSSGTGLIEAFPSAAEYEAVQFASETDVDSLEYKDKPLDDMQGAAAVANGDLNSSASRGQEADSKAGQMSPAAILDDPIDFPESQPSTVTGLGTVRSPMSRLMADAPAFAPRQFQPIQQAQLPHTTTKPDRALLFGSPSTSMFSPQIRVTDRKSLSDHGAGRKPKHSLEATLTAPVSAHVSLPPITQPRPQAEEDVDWQLQATAPPFASPNISLPSWAGHDSPHQTASKVPPPGLGHARPDIAQAKLDAVLVGSGPPVRAGAVSEKTGPTFVTQSEPAGQENTYRSGSPRQSAAGLHAAKLKLRQVASLMNSSQKFKIPASPEPVERAESATVAESASPKGSISMENADVFHVDRQIDTSVQDVAVTGSKESAGTDSPMLDDSPTKSDPVDSAESKRAIKERKKAARDALKVAWVERDIARVRLLAAHSPDGLEAFQDATSRYHEKRDELIAQMAGGQLNEEDAKVYPRFAATDYSVPKGKPAGFAEVRTEILRKQKAKENSSAQSTNNLGTQADFGDKQSLIDTLQAARNLYRQAKDEYKQPQPQSNVSYTTWKKAIDGKVARAIKFYSKKREAVMEAFPDGLPAELQERFPELS